MTNILELNQISKFYGKKKALQDVTLEIAPGRIVGLLGSNGSGKSTLMKLVAGLLHPTSGSIQVAGIPVGLETKSLVSFMPDKPLTESWMKVRDAIAYYRDFYADFDQEKAREMLDFMKLAEGEKVKHLSKGMNERLQLTLALSRKARLYLLDEPIGGVDPVARGKILDAIVKFYDEDSSLIISTHLLNDIERIFDEVIFIREGQMVLREEVETLRLQNGKSVDEMFKEVYAE
ncbi:multidrug ABC transporter ATP-binding protein [Paenibacillus sp. Root52]|uniref:ABC-2 type transport system ATP-binding protein n=1 Tax=Paenibacillus amylolyticus TaxID=1451 RepID=A0AAP5H8A9_PAEAM|nr:MULTISPECIES: ABC transporter ATP-binding protein [Paenibacillus]KQY91121.1 multidrug ABC transporter ATP-binding protein [Paenibacillus sp. Root52]MDR6727060.1 ABC-2 type transport system ATP-binding protein [Paenibacillus amylolyticus]